MSSGFSCVGGGGVRLLGFPGGGVCVVSTDFLCIPGGTGHSFQLAFAVEG